MSQLFYGSVCVTDIVEKAKTGHSAFTKAANGKIYANINIWLNDEKDKYGNVVGLLLSSKKENRDIEGKTYIGNAKASEFQAEPVTAENAASLDLDSANISTQSAGTTANAVNAPKPVDDLPF